MVTQLRQIKDVSDASMKRHIEEWNQMWVVCWETKAELYHA